MSRFFREKRKPRSNTPFNARLTAEQNAAADEQAKRDRRAILLGLVARSTPVKRNGRPIWRGLQPPNNFKVRQTAYRYRSSSAGGMAVASVGPSTASVGGNAP